MNAGDEGVVTCTLPLQNLAVGEAADCTVSVLDQRDWGGCVDVQMVSATMQSCLPRRHPRRSCGTLAHTRWMRTR